MLGRYRILLTVLLKVVPAAAVRQDELIEVISPFALRPRLHIFVAGAVLNVVFAPEITTERFSLCAASHWCELLAEHILREFIELLHGRGTLVFCTYRKLQNDCQQCRYKNPDHYASSSCILDQRTSALSSKVPLILVKDPRAVLPMADETEQKQEAPKIQPASDTLIQPNSIRTKEDEAIWAKMQEPHKLGEHESATHIGLTPEVIADMQKKGQASKLVFFDSKAEEALAALQKPQVDRTLIASNIVPDVPDLEQKSQYAEIQTDSPTPIPDAILAQSLGDNAKRGYRDARNEALGVDIVRVAAPPDIGHPFAGKELIMMRRIPESVWNDAATLFPELTESGITKERTTLLLKGILANELRNYDLKDQADDISVQMTGFPVPKLGRAAEDATLGYSQISVEGVRKLSREFPQVKEYLTKHGYPPGHELKALADPKIAPILIAGNMAHTAKMYENHGVPVSEQSLAYGFNPDISFSREDKKHDKPLTPKAFRHLEREGKHADKALLPTDNVLKASPHVENIQAWLELLSKNGNE